MTTLLRTRTLRPLLVAALLALLLLPAGIVLGGWWQAGLTLVFVLGCFAFSWRTVAPVLYPNGIGFAFRIRARLAYRRAGVRDWHTAASLHHHDLSPADAQRLLAHGHTAQDLHHLGSTLNAAADPDGPLTAAVLLAFPAPDDLRALADLVALPAEDRQDAVAYAGLGGLTLSSVVTLCAARLPFPLAARALSTTPAVPVERQWLALDAFRRVWDHPVLHAALHIEDLNTRTAVDRLAEHLHEWIDAAPQIALARTMAVHDAVDVLADYGTLPLAGWWFAAGYPAPEAREIAEKHDWSIGQLTALAALRHGPVVRNDTETAS